MDQYWQIIEIPSEWDRLEKEKKRLDEINQILNEGHHSPPRKRVEISAPSGSAEGKGKGKGGPSGGKENSAPSVNPFTESAGKREQKRGQQQLTGVKKIEIIPYGTTHDKEDGEHLAILSILLLHHNLMNV